MIISNDCQNSYEGPELSSADFDEILQIFKQCNRLIPR